MKKQIDVGAESILSSSALSFTRVHLEKLSMQKVDVINCHVARKVESELAFFLLFFSSIFFFKSALSK